MQSSGSMAEQGRYPLTPGAKGSDGTSQEAAQSMVESVSRLRRVALNALHHLGQATPLEAIAYLGMSRESIQPRLSELRTMGLIEATGDRRVNPSGRSAAVFRSTGKGLAIVAGSGVQ